ncbi:methylmalonyl Co-A mutase-associated GTPase MeaB [Corynebacterium sp. MSK035]|uniref:methylmalonyl Co-A mutase-associated GTPase MeaB n=1 Tax=Corynebacterium TaxID=1716 RepID=UPI0008A29CD4|nr:MULTISPECIES: methylmalonyl Co-A mutase-associated GTPase MeaB [unclassified Corynebacterium]ASE55990.1 methylmalonyl Co-A mutase-associated GTPase MeaB [Corynebacterium jeikeium]MDU4704653.1 methylmalonyl Co-A mutase-associated GTPase MeaB [Corynebacterium sp.]AYX81810.1 methylmalonyl Co-A mutase-associated GTPase MeaB [Corynebacterium jeikeium]MCQ9349838.1 methylmalonyl Co-A mutase-associated GTPase MeaB [Corynebacterium sp. 5QC2CO]MDK8810752.1 methylmalonyl Co-A mutase-associated GTPase 
MNEYLEENLGTLVTTAGTVVEGKTAVAPEVVRRARRRIDVDDLFEGVRAGNRTKLARAITLLESTAPAHKVLAQELLVKLLPFSGKAMRVGLTGVPGVGKSTTIETLGLKLIEEGHRVAVLAIDPSSTKSGGSILGDKTRMSRLSAADEAFIRPSPSAGTLGGVAKATREAMVVLEAAGYDIVIVETVGVGQSEVAVAQMVDTFAFLALAGAGDQLQGIKKGVLEMADVISINKADGKNLRPAKRAARDLMTAMKMVRSSDQVWTPPVLTMSALEDDGIDKFWQAIEDHVEAMHENHLFDENRANQQIKWMWSMVHETLLQRLNTNEAVQTESTLVEKQLRSGQLTPTLAAQRIMEAFDQGRASNAGLAN